MLKLSRSSLARNLLSNKQYPGFAVDLRDARYLCAYTSHAGLSTTGPNFTTKGNFAGRVFAPYSIYKGKAALSVEPVLPTFTKLDLGGLRVDRRGVLMLTFIPAIGERKYDWERRQKFALSATEVGSFISLGPTDASEFFHDPSMKSSNAGQVKKTLSIKPHADASGYFISLGVNNSILKTTERITVPITSAEFQVIKTACSFALPHIMGWDWLNNQQRRHGEIDTMKLDSRALDLEWNK